MIEDLNDKIQDYVREILIKEIYNSDKKYTVPSKFNLFDYVFISLINHGDIYYYFYRVRLEM